MSALPKAVRAQVEKSNQLAQEYYKSLHPSDGQPPAGEPPATPPAASGEPPATPPAGEPPATPPAAQPPQEGWEQKYKVLQGKYNAEVPRLQNQVRDQNAQLQSFQSQLTATQNLLASLSAQREPAAPASQPATPPATKLVKDEEVKEFGADLIDVMRRVVREEQATLLPEIDRRVAPVAQRVDQVAQAAQQVGARVARSDQQTVLAMLDDQVPKWREVNEDPGFLEWLAQVDPYAGRERGDLLQQAYKAHDGPRVVAFFNGYLKEHAAVTPPATPKPAAAAPAPQRTLEQMVAPGTPKTGAAGTQDGSGKRVWTRKEIGQFYSDVQAGRFKGTAEQRKQIEADIFAAQRENRIR